MLRAMEPDSLLYAVSSTIRRVGFPRARSLDDVRSRSGRRSPYGRGHAPVAAEAEALLGALEDAEATVFASGMTAWTCVCLTLLGQGKAIAIPTSGYYEVELLRRRSWRASAWRCGGTSCATPTASAAPATARRSPSSRRPPIRRSQ